MSITHYCILLVTLVLLGLANVASAITAACLPTNLRKNGMNINFYQYSLKDSSTYSNAAYMAYGYANKVKLGSVSGQTDISINYNLPCITSSGTFKCPQENAYGDWGCRGKGRCSNSQGISYWSTDLFGFYTTPTNVTLEMTGYFLPSQTGSYTFAFATVDDSAILSIGGSTAFDCCAQQQPPITSTNFTINGIKPWHQSLPSNIKGSVYMYAGYYYPMKIVYSNAVSWGTLPVSVTLPDGTIVSDDFEGYVYSFDNNLSQPNCTISDPSNHTTSDIITTTTEAWTGTFTTESTQMTTVTGLNGLATDETIIVLRTPTTVSTVTTTTEAWTGTFTTGSTQMTTLTGTDGLATDETIIVIRTPTTVSTVTTTTEAWTGTFTTESTQMTTLTGTDGLATDETIIVIRTPTTVSTVTTTTEAWTGTFTTESTQMTTLTGTDGLATDETIIVIRTPTTVSTVTTTTEAWTGTFTTESTQMTIVNGTNGLATDETIIVIRTPTTVSTVTTTTEAWTGTFTTESTQMTTLTGTDGLATDETIIVIRTPTTVSTVTTTTEAWTGTFTTESTQMTTLTGTDGLATDETIIVIRTPTTVSTVTTTTEAWTGTFTTESTQMTTLTGTDGLATDETIIVIRTPTTVSTVTTTTEAWTGTFTTESTQMTIVNGTNGLATDETIIVIRTPITVSPSSVPPSRTEGLITTTTEPWSGTFLTSTTEVTTVNGTNGNPTYETVIVIKTPVIASSVMSSDPSTSARSSSVLSSRTEGLITTITQPWTGTFTTESTQMTIVNGTNGLATDETIIVIRTPITVSPSSVPPSRTEGLITTTTEPWSGTFLTSTTEVTTVNGTNGNPTYETVIVIKTPVIASSVMSSDPSTSARSSSVLSSRTEGLITTITQPWTGTFTTESTQMTIVNGTNGLATDETIIVIRTPITVSPSSVPPSRTEGLITTTTEPWSGTFLTSTTEVTTVNGTNGNPTYETVIVIKTPVIASSVMSSDPSTSARSSSVLSSRTEGLITTITQPWTGTFTTESTQMTIVNGTNGLATDETIIVIRTPITVSPSSVPPSRTEGLITTTTEPWSGTFLTSTTEVTTVNGTNGNPTYETVIVIKTPVIASSVMSSDPSTSARSSSVLSSRTEGLITTITQPWTGTFTTESTQMTIVNGTNGLATDETIIVIRTPITVSPSSVPPSRTEGLITTTTEPWSGTFLTSTTEVTTVNGTNGNPTYETVIVIKTPVIASSVMSSDPSTSARSSSVLSSRTEGLITTITQPWTGTFTTESTQMTIVNGTNGLATDETIIVIRTPITVSPSSVPPSRTEGLITTTTEPWSGTFLTSTTEVTTVNGTNGNPTYETVIVIKTPVIASSVMSSDPSTSARSSSVLSSRTEGLITTITQPWTGTFTTESTQMTIVNGTNGLATDETIIVIRTPITVSPSSVPPSRTEGLITTITQPWTGTFTTESTQMTIVNGTNGLATDETIIVIRTPITVSPSSVPPSRTEGLITTTTEPWSGTFVTSTTEVTTVIGTNGNPTYETVIAIRTPTSPSSSSARLSTSGNVISFVTSSHPIITPLYPSNATSAISYSSTRSKEQQITVSSISTLSCSFCKSSGSIFLSSVISTSPSETQTSQINSSGNNFKNHETSSTSATSSVLPKTSISLAIQSHPSITTIDSVNDANGAQPSDSRTEIIGLTSTSSSKSQNTENDITYGLYHDLTVIQKITTTATKKSKKITSITVTSCKSHMCTESIFSAIGSTTISTVSEVSTQYSTWDPISSVASTEQISFFTGTSCESGICFNTIPPAIVSKVTATIDNTTKIYPTLNAHTTNEADASFSIFISASGAPTSSESAITNTISYNGAFSSSGSGYAETHTKITANNVSNRNTISFSSETANTRESTTARMGSVSQQRRTTAISAMLQSSSASLEISSYLGIANGLLANSALCVFISSVLLAIV